MNAILAGESSAIAAEPSARRLLSAPEFQRLVEVPPEVQWFSVVCQKVFQGLNQKRGAFADYVVKMTEIV